MSDPLDRLKQTLLNGRETISAAFPSENFQEINVIGSLLQRTLNYMWVLLGSELFSPAGYVLQEAIVRKPIGGYCH